VPKCRYSKLFPVNRVSYELSPKNMHKRETPVGDRDLEAFIGGSKDNCYRITVSPLAPHLVLGSEMMDNS
jgi:hypothetical protein